jgi:hypothetical protein
MHPRPKPFSWSYTALKNFENCPRRHHEVDKLKNFREEESDALLWGNQLHDAMEKRISKGTPLPLTMQRFEKWANPFAVATMDPDNPSVQVRTELKLAFTRQFQASSYFDNGTWFRAKVDVLVVIPGHKMAMAIDWKTGKILEDFSQLALAAQCVFANYPEIDKVASVYAWLGDDAKTVDVHTRAGMASVWNGLWPRVEALEQAHANQYYPPRPSGLCKRYCPVTSCEYHGKGSY